MTSELAVTDGNSTDSIMPLVTPAQAKAEWQAYVDLVAAIGTTDDYQSFYDKKTKTTKNFPKKSLCRKLARYFGLDLTLKSIERVPLDDGHFAFEAVATATAPNGKKQDGDGACTTMEERFDLTPYDDESPQRFEIRRKKALARAYHDVRGTAVTRAKNRATMDLIGAGQVTADEISRERQPQVRQEPKPPAEATLAELHDEIYGLFCSLELPLERADAAVEWASSGRSKDYADLDLDESAGLIGKLRSMRRQATREATA